MCQGLCRFPTAQTQDWSQSQAQREEHNRTKDCTKPEEYSQPFLKLLLARNRGSHKEEKRWRVKWTVGRSWGTRALDGDSGSGQDESWHEKLLASPGCSHKSWWAQRAMPRPLWVHLWVAKGQGCVSHMRWNKKFLKINTKDHTKQEERLYRGKMNQKSFYI